MDWFSHMIILLEHLQFKSKKLKSVEKKLFGLTEEPNPNFCPKWTIEIPVEVWKSLHDLLKLTAFHVAQHFPAEPEWEALRSLWSAVSQVFQTHACTKKLQESHQKPWPQEVSS